MVELSAIINRVRRMVATELKCGSVRSKYANPIAMRFMVYIIGHIPPKVMIVMSPRFSSEPPQRMSM